MHKDTIEEEQKVWWCECPDPAAHALGAGPVVHIHVRNLCLHVYCTIGVQYIITSLFTGW